MLPRRIFYFLLWCIVLLSGYFIFHWPVTISQVQGALSSLFHLAISALVLLACAGLGSRWMGEKVPKNLAGLSMQAALGAGMASLACLGLGLAGLFQTWVFAALLVICLVLFRKDILTWLQGFTEWLGIWRQAGRLERGFLVGAVFLIGIQVFIALAPPVKYDALTYHLALPRLYLQTGGLVFTPENPYWGHPQIVEMLFTWAAGLGQPITAATLSWWVGILFLSGIAGLVMEVTPNSDQPGNRTRQSQVAIAAVTFTVIGTTARWMLGWAYTDLFSAWFGFSALYGLYLWHQTGEKRWFFWCGVFVGLAVSTKYTAGILGLAVFFIAPLLRGFRKPPLRTWLAGGAVALAIFLPWALKNFSFTGNPLFPYLFPTQWYSSDRLATANLPPENYQILPHVLYPLYLTWTGVDSASGPSTDLGPLLLMFTLPALLTYRRNAWVRFYGLSLLLCWIVIGLAGSRFGHLQQPRLYFALLPAYSALAAWGWPVAARLSSGRVRMRRIVGVIVLLVLALSAWQDINRIITSRAVAVVTGNVGHDVYLEENTGAYITAMRNLELLPDDSRVLMLWEARSLYAPDNSLPDPWIDAFRYAYRSLADPQSILADWQANYTHLLVYLPGMQMMREEDRGISPAGWDAFDQILATLNPPLEIGGPYYLLYEIK